jgi:putative DNA primase/helicase
LAWLIDGCLAWQREGLNPPQAVIEATAAYLSAEDAPGLWLAERAELGPNYFKSTRVLFDWKIWCDRTGEKCGTEKKFAQKMRDMGFQEGRCREGVGNPKSGFWGIKLKPQEHENVGHSHNETEKDYE